MNNTEAQIISKITAMNKKGEKIADILREIQRQNPNDPNPKLSAIRYFMLAFRLPLKDVSHLGGWIGFEGGELSDEELETIKKIEK